MEHKKSSLFICVLVLLGTFNLSECLKCHACSNTESFQSCLEEKGVEECPANLVCSKFSYKLRKDDGDLLQVYGRACQNKDNCKDSKTFCRTSKLLSDCTINCCEDKDMCNAGSKFVVSGILLIACALCSMVHNAF